MRVTNDAINGQFVVPAPSGPTDAKLYHRLRVKLVADAKVFGVELRQSYTRKSKQTLVMQGRYRHARQMKRARKSLKKLKVYLGRVTRDIERKVGNDSKLQERFKSRLEMSHRLLAQQRTSKNKLYSLHPPSGGANKKQENHRLSF